MGNILFKIKSKYDDSSIFQVIVSCLFIIFCSILAISIIYYGVEQRFDDLEIEKQNYITTLDNYLNNDYSVVYKGYKLDNIEFIKDEKFPYLPKYYINYTDKIIYLDTN